MENITEKSFDSKLDELMSNHNFDTIYKTKLNILHKCTAPLPKVRVIQTKSCLTELTMPSILFHQHKLDFAKLPRKYSDEPIHTIEDTPVTLKKEQSLESEYHLIEMHENVANLDNEILSQFQLMKACSKLIAKVPAPTKVKLLKMNKSKTLALDLDETLIHTQNPSDLFFVDRVPTNHGLKKIKVNKDAILFSERPYLKQFLNELSAYFNIVVRN
jgi:hypothetical protein